MDWAQNGLDLTFIEDYWRRVQQVRPSPDIDVALDDILKLITALKGRGL